ncbi:MAG TPA: sulfite exporter TauE/SafE family protein [Dehalococcoidia bacterium]|nr:sulfite exporter TauE/SafE family protein [Dehalococcoidia bacterium]
MDTETALLAGLIAFVAAVCQAVTGFAFALIFAPLFALAWEPKPAVAVAVLLSVVVNALVLLQVRGHITHGSLPGLYAGYLVGVGPGLLFLQVVSGEVLQITLGVVVLFATMVLYVRPKTETGPDTILGRLAAGAASGASASATSIGGPPVVLYMLGREPDMHRFRATLQAYFLPISIFTLTLFVIVGRIDRDVLTAGGVAAPLLALGVLVGAWLRGHIHAELFRRLVVGMLVAMSLMVVLFAVVDIA